jgi:hypothetical protein
MRQITRRAERKVKKLLQELSPDDREQLVADLLGPIPYRLCDIITHREKHRLFHYRARCRTAIRICFRRSGSDTVVLDVARHDEFEEFANNFTGSYGTCIPIEESRVMRKYAMNGTAPKVPQPFIPPGGPAPEPSGQDAAELLAWMVLGSRAFGERARMIDDTIEKFMDDARDGAIAKIGGDLENIEGRLADRDAAFEGIRGAINTIRSDVTALDSRVAAHRGEVESHLEAQRAGLSAVETQLAGSIAEWNRDLTTIRTDVHNIEVRFGDFGREVQARLGIVAATLAEDRTSQLVSRLDRLAGDSEGFGRRLHQQDAHLVETNNTLDTCREEVAALRLMLAESAARARGLGDQVAALQAWLHDHVARLDREREDRGRRTFKARWFGFVGAVRSAYASSKRFRFTRRPLPGEPRSEEGDVAVSKGCGARIEDSRPRWASTVR